MRGEPGGAMEVAQTIALRGTLISLGLAIVGFRGKALLVGTLGAACGIEIGVLAWAWFVSRSAYAVATRGARRG